MLRHFALYCVIAGLFGVVLYIIYMILFYPRVPSIARPRVTAPWPRPHGLPAPTAALQARPAPGRQNPKNTKPQSLIIILQKFLNNFSN